jgi:hypothetical protein
MAFSKRASRILAAFRQVPTDLRKNKRDAFRIDSLVEVLTQEHRIGHGSLEENLIARWKEIIGEAHASRCAPVRVDPRRTLVIQVAHPLLRRELTFQRQTILKRVREVPGCQEIRDLVFIQSA